ncbi:polysaccharide deacetylase family protein [Herbiconiux sp. CPCC 205716]|uniref:Polysaccharide deacetylase family protein n=1 Tax=Herbiconiux gentiana TaxID=2970912 RepID=A0ABT2GBB0_9MICO|nr:polysaccharide deacetylase family protein [Herbiconiux gentiana]MCS5713457.1 polysaccharide deacetylase family protein [Herbiconiux gentiana]
MKRQGLGADGGGFRTVRRRVGASIGAAAVVGVLAGCASVPPAAGTWEPRQPEPAVVTVTVDGGATTASGTVGQEPPPQSPAGFDARLLYNGDTASPVAARWGEIPGNPGFTEMLRGRVLAAVADHAAATGVAFTPAADAPTLSPETRGCVAGSTSRPAAELLADPAFTPPSASGAPTLTVTCEIVAGAGTVIAQAIRFVTSAAGQVSSDETTVYFAETSGAFTVTSDAFLSDDGLRQLLRDIVQSLKAEAGALRPEMVQSTDDFVPEQLRDLFSHLTLGADGSLTVRVAAGFTVPELDQLAAARAGVDEPHVVTVPADLATPLLSEQGRQIQAALTSGAPLSLPAAGPRGDEDVDCTVFACIAVTFDDGPGQYTGAVLDALAERRAAATFYVQGYRVEQNRGMLVRADAEGHQIGNHTWNHPDLTKLPDAEVRSQLDRTSALIRATIGAAPTTFRPPYGAVDKRVLDDTALPAILWTVDTLDWQLPDDDVLLGRAVTSVDPGDIVLLHDVHENTARMTPAILDGLLGRGFTLVTVEQLLGGTPSPHTTTRSR